tara:strand:+ start:1551 stop:1874 length:324 start_codon:yes stop_codon:yes gene_type:complete
MKYEQQAGAPDFWNSDPKKIYISASSGSSPFNEWYEFADRSDAVKHIEINFSSSSFHDHFQAFKNEIYEMDQFTPESFEADDLDGWSLKPNAEPADLQEIIWAESKF